MTASRSFVDKCFKDEKGRVVITQKPNYPILIWFATVVLRLFQLNANLETTIAFIGDCFLFLWAWWEITDGVNYFRRALGVVILTLLILTRLIN